MSWWARFTNVLRPDRVDRDLDDEQRFHIESRAEDLAREGLSRQEALEQASRQFGHRLTLRESSRDVKAPAVAGFPRTRCRVRRSPAAQGCRRVAGRGHLAGPCHRCLHGCLLAHRRADSAPSCRSASPIDSCTRSAQGEVMTFASRPSSVTRPSIVSGRPLHRRWTRSA